MSARVALVFPRIEYRTGDPPLGLAYLAAALRRARPKLDIQLIDGTFLGDERTLLRAVENSGATVVGVFVDSLVLPRAFAVAERARHIGAFALAGGPAVSVAPDRFVPAFDAALIGEGEELIVDVVDRALERAALDDVPNLVYRGEDDEPVATPREARPPDLDSLAFPAWDLLDMDAYLARWPYLDCVQIDAAGTNIVGSRGCPWQCTYCQPTLKAVFGPRLRRRSPANIVEEIRALRKAYGVDGVFFHDDTITANRAWLLELCEQLGREGVLWGCNSRVDVLETDLIDAMVDAGMRSIHLGVEAGSARVREDVLDKHVDIDHLQRQLVHLRRRGAHALGFFMLGSPSESLGEMLRTVLLARRLHLTEATFSVTSVLRGTRLHGMLDGDPRYVLRSDQPVDYYNARNFEDLESGVGDRTIRAVQLAALASFYLHPYRADYLLRHLTTRKGLTKLAMKAARFLKPFVP